MSNSKQLKNALISVFHKDNLEPIIRLLEENGVNIYSTGGTQNFVEGLGVSVNAVENLTSYPSILGGRVKTLHPKVFGGILSRRHLDDDLAQLKEFEIPEFDLVIVDLYPFEATVASGAPEADVIEKIDIGGISLIRAAAKNYRDVVVVASQNDYSTLETLLREKGGSTDIEDRKQLARNAFNVSSHYDTAIFNYFADNDGESLKLSEPEGSVLRYGENPHQSAKFFGKLDELFEQLHGKALSYNNLLDVDAAVSLIGDFPADVPTVAVLKHNNACGLACRPTLFEAWKDALAGDPVSAFGGIIISNQTIDAATAEEINKIFCEVVIAPGFEAEALTTLQSKKNRILLKQNHLPLPQQQVRSILNGVLQQDRDAKVEQASDLQTVTAVAPDASQIDDLLFANILVKHTKSNAIILAKNKQLLGSGTGQTSRVDALKHAIVKAQSFEFDLEGAVMASDAFFPFPDCVEIADQSGIKAVIQPGGSKRDQESVDYCNAHDMTMVLTGTRHFKH